MNGRPKSSCQLVPPGESGQKDSSESGQKSGALLMSIDGGAGSELRVLSPSDRALQTEFSGKARPRFSLSSERGILPCKVSSDPSIRESTGPVDKRVNSDDDDCLSFSTWSRTSAVALPVSTSCDRFSGEFLDEINPTDFLRRRFLDCVY